MSCATRTRRLARLFVLLSAASASGGCTSQTGASADPVVVVARSGSASGGAGLAGAESAGAPGGGGMLAMGGTGEPTSAMGAPMGGSGGTDGSAAGSNGGGAAAIRTVMDAAIPAVDGGAPTPYTPLIKVVSFNLRYGTADDGDDSWPNRRELTFQVMREQAADLIGVQEALSFQLEEIDTALPGYARIGVGRNDGMESGEFSAIYYRADRFHVVASETFWFSDTPQTIGSTSWGNTIPRICTWGHFVESDTGYGLFLYNVHLDHQSQQSREQSVALLMQRASQRGAEDPVFVTGDFNAGEDNTATRFMTGMEAVDGAENPLPLLDSYRVLHPQETQAGTAHGFDGATDGAKIDYVFVQPEGTVLSAEIVHANDAGRYPSDHFPVVATLKLPTQDGAR